MSILKRWSLRQLLHRHAIDDSVWRETVETVNLVSELEPAQRARLRVLTTRFLREKTFTGAAGLEPTAQMRTMIGALACLLVLKLRLRRYHGWREIVIYPSGFRVKREIVDEVGIVHHGLQDLRGEAWQRGVVVLSWEDVLDDTWDSKNNEERYPGNVVLHEFAHKLDMQNGHSNGMPPLHRRMIQSEWTVAFSEAFTHLQWLHDTGLPGDIDPYGATDPAEFFAVMTEVFFVQPQALVGAYPQVYNQLHRFYRQDPLQRRRL